MFLSLIFSLVMSISGVAQHVVKSQKDWQHELKSNALEPHIHSAKFAFAKPGFALYYSDYAGVRQPYLVYVPHGYYPEKPMPLVVFMHGAVLALDSFQYDNPEVALEPVFRVADSLHVLVLFPFARRDFKWQSNDKVCENILKMIDKVKLLYHTDSSLIIIGGQSMGGNATFWFIRHCPGRFNGFFTFSASPDSDDLAAIPETVKNTPIVSCNAMDDKSFPIDLIRKTHEQFKNMLPNWKLLTVSTGGHRFIYNPGGEKYVYNVIQTLLSEKPAR